MMNVTYVFGSRKYKRFIRFHFLGWADEAMRKTYHNSVGHFFDEMRAKRTEPKLDFAMEIDHEGDSVSEGGSVKGSDIEVMYDEREMTPEKIESFLARSGLHIERANPFFFTQSIWKRVTGILLAPILIPFALVLWFIVWIANRRAVKNPK